MANPLFHMHMQCSSQYSYVASYLYVLAYIPTAWAFGRMLLADRMTTGEALLAS